MSPGRDVRPRSRFVGLRSRRWHATCQGTRALSRPVEIGALALKDIDQARAWFEAQERGLGDTFLNRVTETIQRLAQNPEQYQVKLLDLRQAPVRPFKHSVWYYLNGDGSVVVACLSGRRDTALAGRRSRRDQAEASAAMSQDTPAGVTRCAVVLARAADHAA